MTSSMAAIIKAQYTPQTAAKTMTSERSKDLWQHRRQCVVNTRWWPPFCLVVDWVAAAILVRLLAAGVDFHQG